MSRRHCDSFHVLQWTVGFYSLLLAWFLGTSEIRAEERQTPPLKGLFCNIDDSVFFNERNIPDGKAGELIDQYVDVMKESGTTALLCCTNARRTNYRSKVWDAYWDGYDPNATEDQPFFAAVPKEERAGIRKWIHNTWLVDHQGVDYPARMIERCRHDGISPWITLRMNDCHYNNIPDHPFHGNFWKKNPQFFIKGRPGYFEHCLDYAHPEVRDFFKALVVETLDRYDIDGLDLDFMRECFIFSAGQEAQGKAILTDWLRGIHELVQKASAERKHPIWLSIRIPSRPEVAVALGFDFEVWAREGLVDLLVPTPRWSTVEFDIPLEQWREKLGVSKVALGGGLEILYRPCFNGAAAPVSPELAKGAALAVWSRGADVLYLFNYFQDSDPHAKWSVPVYEKTLKTMGSLEALLKEPRTIGITYRDITAPSESYRSPLPAQGKQISLSLQLGPLPSNPWQCDLVLEFAPIKDQPFVTPEVAVNGRACEVSKEETLGNGHRVMTFRTPLETLAAQKVQEIKIQPKDSSVETSYRVERAEMALYEPGKP